MKLPKRVKIGYRTYEFQMWDKNYATSNEASGEFFAKEGAIGLSINEDNVSHANTLIHEILHAIVYQWGLDISTEEKIVNTIANGLTTVCVDNKWLLPYIQKNLTKEE